MIQIYQSELDLLICAGPNLRTWPEASVTKLISELRRDHLRIGTARAGVLTVRGVLPHQKGGAFVMAEDAQGRVHEIHTRSVVAITNRAHSVYGFKGNHSRYVIGGDVAESLLLRGMFHTGRPAVVLGGSNHAYRFGIRLLEAGCPKVTIVVQGGVGAWEVLRRRYHSLGGVTVNAVPLELRSVGVDLCELIVQDSMGRRILESSKVITYHPQSHRSSVEESAAGSMLFRWWVTHSSDIREDPQGHSEAEEIALEIAQKISMNLGPLYSTNKKTSKNQRLKLKHIREYESAPLNLSFAGKWLETEQSPHVDFKKFNGISIECFERIGCKVCSDACPEKAINVVDARPKVLDDLCTKCGICLVACPASVPVVMESDENTQYSKLTLSVRGKLASDLKERKLVDVLNRRGEKMGQGRVVETRVPENSEKRGNELSNLLTVMVPMHLVQEVRSVRVTLSALDQDLDKFYAHTADGKNLDSIDLWVSGQKRRAIDHENLAAWLTSVGLQRPEDRLMCSDGSCGLCKLSVDGVSMRACQTKTRSACRIEMSSHRYFHKTEEKNFLCPCVGITEDEAIEVLENGTAKNLTDLVEKLRIGRGRCHGQLCMDHTQQVFERHRTTRDLITSPSHFWTFPWIDWTLPGL